MEEGRPAYHRALLLKVWLYAYALGVTWARRLEQRVREDLAFRYLAAGAGPDFWTLNQFRTRHARALNDLFTQVVELARSLGMGRLGHVAMDSTRVAANTSRDRVETVAKLRAERAKIRRQIRRWQKQCEAPSGEEAAGQQLSGKQMAALEKRLEEIPRCLEGLRKSGLKRRSETDPDSRLLRDRKGFTLGYTAEIAVGEDHLIVEQRVGQNATDNATLVPLVETVERRCRERPWRARDDERNIAGPKHAAPPKPKPRRRKSPGSRSHAPVKKSGRICASRPERAIRSAMNAVFWTRAIRERASICPAKRARAWPRRANAT